MRSISVLIFLLTGANIFGQVKTVTGKVIDEFSQSPLAGITIGNSDTLRLAETDMQGNFKIEIPLDTQSLQFIGVGLERTIINFKVDCNYLEIIMMPQSSYDFITLKKVDRLRMRRFQKLPELHKAAYQKGIFTTEKACYEQQFMRESPSKNSFPEEISD